MKRARVAAVLAFSMMLLCLPVQPAAAASGYDMTDLWWNPAESGWGIKFIQQRDTVFATLYVYDTDNTPVWYAATLDFTGLTPQTHDVNYAGDLYRGTGPWFGATPFDPSQVVGTKVGTMTLMAPSMTAGTLTYTVGAVTVTKSIERQTFRLDDYNGAFDGVLSVTASRCTNPADDGTRTHHAAFNVAQVGTAMTIDMTSPAWTCSFAGTYGQDGRLGRFGSSYSCTNGESGTAMFNEMNVQRFGLVGRMFGADTRGCHLEGTIAAAER